jgi:hypothetical protein
MKKNVGKTDRISRLIIGISILIIGILQQSWLGLIGAGIILPAIIGSDPLYSLIGVNTNKS